MKRLQQCFLKETDVAKMILYTNTEALDLSPDNDTNF